MSVKTSTNPPTIDESLLDTVVERLKGKDRDAVERILEKMELDDAVKEAVLSKLGYDPRVRLYVPNDTLGYLMSLANPIVRTGLKSLVLSTPWSDNVRKFVEKIYNDFGASDLPISREVMEFVLTDMGVPKLEARSLADKAAELATLDDPSQINYLITEVSKRASRIKVKHEVERFLNGEFDVMNFVQRVSEIKEMSNYAYIPILDLASTTPSEVMRQYGGGDVIPSFFSFVNEALPGGGYQRGQVVMINAVPGGGKTTFMLNEAVNAAYNGYRVLYVSLGDMMPHDFFVKIIGIMKDLTVAEVMKDIDRYWADPDIQKVAKNLKVSVLPAGSLTADELYAASSKKATGVEYDVVVVDYDANLKGDADVSLYERGRVVYEALSAISRDEPLKLVLVGSQVKQTYWKSDIIPLDAAAESSNKQAVVDVMITIGKNPGRKKEADPSWVHAGYLNIAKARRGLVTPTSYTPYKLTSSGRFVRIGEAEYAELYHPLEPGRGRRY